jgi:hypothetical protein
MKHLPWLTLSIRREHRLLSVTDNSRGLVDDDDNDNPYVRFPTVFVFAIEKLGGLICGHPLGDFWVSDYRAYTVGSDGHFDGYEPLICDNDDDAIAKACALLGAEDIELWSGARLVTKLTSRKKPGSITS